MSTEIRELLSAARTFLEAHGRNRVWVTRSWKSFPAGSSRGGHPSVRGTEVLEEECGSPANLPEEDPLSTAFSPHARDLGELCDLWGECTRCKLASGRKHLVFGEGSPSDLMFIGEGPGEQEDLQGRPFVGRAGELLTRMIEAMGLSRDQVYIANIVKCRPPGNRDPEPDEMVACMPLLVSQIGLVRPKVLVALGRISAQALLQTSEPIGRLRGRWHRVAGRDLMPTFHPAYLLRSPDKKREAWQDLQMVLEKLREKNGPNS